MQHIKQLSVKEIIAGIMVGVLFLSASFGSQEFAQTLKAFIGGGGITAMLWYDISVIILAIVPLGSTLPLIPIAVATWGKGMAIILTVAGWTISASAAFYAARRFGKRLIIKLVPPEYLEGIQRVIQYENLRYVVLIFALIGAPVDVQSYAFALFTPIGPFTFLLWLAMGLFPFAFFVTFTATLPIIYQTYIISLLIVGWFFFYTHVKYQSKKGEGE